MASVDNDLKLIGETVRFLRKKKGISQEELGAQADLDRTYISDIELGMRNFGIKNLIKLAKVLSVKPSQLLKKVE